ncbi:MAG: nuclear transport factor 2 family protein [Pyrinomonadaceae bacterium]|nr:nuclear transport factor 2 family protein [Pyrinomonadaceae bacterium]
MKRLFLVITFSLLFIGIAFPQTKDDKAKNEIKKVMDTQVIAWNNGDIDGFMKGYWNSPELTFVSGTNVTKGWQPTLERYKKGYDSKAKMGTLTFSDLEITLLGKDSAVVLGKWALQREKDNPKGLFTLTFRKFKDGWRIILDHTS